MDSVIECGPQFFDNIMFGKDFGDESPFEEAGFPFDEPLSRGRTDIKSHLEDLAHRHPEFAEHLQYPAWGNGDSWSRKQQEPREKAQSVNPEAAPVQQDTAQQQPQHPAPEPEVGDALRGRVKDSLSSTVPDMGQKQQEGEDKESRGQRSWSAPPDNRTQTDKPRFVSKIEIQPVNPDAVAKSSDSTKPPMAPPKHQPNSQTQQQPPHTQPKQPQSNVRHIPIFVEGRDEPVLPKNVEPEFSQAQAPSNLNFPGPHPQHQFNAPSQQQTPPQHDKNQHFEQQPEHHQQQPQTKMEQPAQQSEQHPPEPPVNLRDPLFRVSCVQKEVDELKTKVDGYNGTSRSDKEYILLDELLTRNLIKLDDIETEGKEEVRTARKNAIKCIQRCISELENKIPIPSDNTSDSKEKENIDGDQIQQEGDSSTDVPMANLPEEQNNAMNVDNEDSSTKVLSSSQVNEEVKDLPSEQPSDQFSDKKEA